MTLNAPEKGQRSERLIEQKSTFIIGITMSIFIWPARTKKMIQPPGTGSCYVARLMPDEEMLKLMIVHNGRRDILGTPRAQDLCEKKWLDDSQDCHWIQKTQNTSQFEKNQTNPRIFINSKGFPPKTSPNNWDFPDPARLGDAEGAVACVSNYVMLRIPCLERGNTPVADICSRVKYAAWKDAV